MSFIDKIKSFFTGWLPKATAALSEEALHIVNSVATVLVRNLEQVDVPGDHKGRVVTDQLLAIVKEAGINLGKQELNLIKEQALKNVRDANPKTENTTISPAASAN